MNGTTHTQAGRRILQDISPSAFQHPLDRQATEQLKRVRGFDKIAQKFIEYGFERLNYVLNIASSVRVGPKQLPQIHQMLQECCAILDMEAPELYVAQGEVNAYTAGHTKPYIVLFTGLIDSMSDQEVMAVIAHELGHIKCGHVLYKTMASQIAIILEFAGDITLGIGGLLGMPIQAALTIWDRRSELSADRAALLVMQDPALCITMLMKLAGGSVRLSNQLNPEEFLVQVREYSNELDDTTLDKFYRLWASLYKGTHPFAIERAKELNDWVDSPEYSQIIQGIYPTVPTTVARNVRCKKCGEIPKPNSLFCARCGTSLKA